MATASLAPAYVVLRYETPYSVHTQTIPTLAYSNSGFTDPGSFETHNAGSVNGDTMVEALVDALAGAYDSTTSYLDYQIYTKADQAAEPIFRYGKTYNVAGTATLTGVDRAVQQTFVFRTSNNGFAKLVLLDRKTNNAFGKFVTLSTEEQALVDEFVDADKGWSARDNGQPALFIGNSITMNSRLERKYPNT